MAIFGGGVLLGTHLLYAVLWENLHKKPWLGFAVRHRKDEID